MALAASWQAGLFLAVMVAAYWWARTDVRRLAFVTGVLLPIDHLTGVTHPTIAAVRYLGILAIIVVVPAHASEPAKRIATRLVGILLLLSAIRLVYSLAQHDGAALRYTVPMVVGGTLGLFVAYRPVLYRPLIAGWLSGITLSAVVSLMQVLSLPTLRQPDFDNSRYPGLSNRTMGFTWQMAFGFILWMYVFAVSGQRPWLRVAASAGAGACLIAMLVNGAQGGLLALGTGTCAVLWVLRSSLTWDRVRVPLLVAVGSAIVAAGALALGWIELATVDGLVSSNFESERARFDVFKHAWREIAAHPFTGLGRTNFKDRYVISPHNLALDSGVIAGLLGVVLGFALFGYAAALWVGGPRDRRPETIAAFVLLAAMLPNFFTETQGPFVGLGRIIVLLIALLTVTGHLPTEDPAVDPSPRPPDLSKLL